jgi:hypothetical protein
MALDDELDTIAEALKNVIADLSADTKIFAANIFLWNFPTTFTLPIALIEEEAVDLIRGPTGQGQYQIDFMVTCYLRAWTQQKRSEDLRKLLATLMRYVMRNPTLKGTVMNVEVRDGRTAVLDLPGRDQGAEGLTFRVRALEEPIDLTPV